MFRDFYQSDLQSVWAVELLPILYLLWRAFLAPPRQPGAPPIQRRIELFIDCYATVFAFETLIDPLATNPMLKALGIADSHAATAVTVFFVLLGDFRVYLLVFALLALSFGAPWRQGLPLASCATLLVPIVAVAVNQASRRRWPGLDANAIWLIYETSFFFVALALRRHVRSAPPLVRGALRDVLAYVAVYYALWALSDVLIQVFALDVGWLLRIVPNQLYYGLWIPFVVWRCRFAASDSAAGDQRAALRREHLSASL